MGYDYSDAFLTQNADLVRQFTDLARTGGIAYVTFADPDEMARTRFHYNNVLATLALRHPDLSWIRETVRTWLAYDDKTQEWTLYVGKPQHKLRGRSVRSIVRPTVPRPTSPAQAQPASVASDPTLVTVPDQYTDGTVLALVQRITNINEQQAVRTATFTNLAITQPERVLVPYLRNLKDRGGWAVTHYDERGGKLVALTITRPEYRSLLTFEDAPDAKGV